MKISTLIYCSPLNLICSCTFTLFDYSMTLINQSVAKCSRNIRIQEYFKKCNSYLFVDLYVKFSNLYTTYILG